MKTNIHFCSYINEFFFKMRNVPEKVVEKINMYNNFFKKIVPFMR